MGSVGRSGFYSEVFLYSCFVVTCFLSLLVTLNLYPLFCPPGSERLLRVGRLGGVSECGASPDVTVHSFY